MSIEMNDDLTLHHKQFRNCDILILIFIDHKPFPENVIS